MKKIIITLIMFLALYSAAYADNVFVIPADILNQVAKSVEFKAETTFIQRLIINQIIKNSKINGVKLDELKPADLIEYFSQNGVFKKIDDTKLIEPNTGATLMFDSLEACKNNSCTITLDLNGDKGPNELWTDAENPKDQIRFYIKKTVEGDLEVQLPDYVR